MRYLAVLPLMPSVAMPLVLPEFPLVAASVWPHLLSVAVALVVLELSAVAKSRAPGERPLATSLTASDDPLVYSTAFELNRANEGLGK